MLWVKHRRDGRCLVAEDFDHDCDFELIPHLIDEEIGDVESNIITLCGRHDYQATTGLIEKTFLRRKLRELYDYEIQY